MIRVESPFPSYALPRVWTWIEEFRDRVTDDYGPQTLEQFIARWGENPERKTWGVWRDEELGGLVTWEPGPNPDVGVTHVTFKRTFWGRAVTREALKLIYSELFDGGVRKVVGFPYKGNCAMISLAKELGARSEGTLRQQTMRHGVPVDVVVLGLLKEDFYKWRSMSSAHGSQTAPKK
jgi:RimJ/RimL family protein N-acetyltransferase